jgi:hypothetical protein
MTFTNAELQKRWRENNSEIAKEKNRIKYKMRHLTDKREADNLRIRKLRKYQKEVKRLASILFI